MVPVAQTSETTTLFAGRKWPGSIRLKHLLSYQTWSNLTSAERPGRSRHWPALPRAGPLKIDKLWYLHWISVSRLGLITIVAKCMFRYYDTRTFVALKWQMCYRMLFTKQTSVENYKNATLSSTWYSNQTSFIRSISSNTSQWFMPEENFFNSNIKHKSIHVNVQMNRIMKWYHDLREAFHNKSLFGRNCLASVEED